MSEAHRSDVLGGPTKNLGLRNVHRPQSNVPSSRHFSATSAGRHFEEEALHYTLQLHDVYYIDKRLILHTWKWCFTTGQRSEPTIIAILVVEFQASQS